MSLRSAVNAKCRDCIYDVLGVGTWRAQVQACDAEGLCPLWPVRPISSKKSPVQNLDKEDEDDE